jgi:hypothetical protein
MGKAYFDNNFVCINDNGDCVAMSDVVRTIEIPGRRVCEVDRDYFEQHYTRVDENGKEVAMSEPPYLVVRNSDSKVFKLAKYVPYGWQARDCVYLEEL